MWGRRIGVATSPVPYIKPVHKPKPIKLTTEVPPEEYRDLCARIGFAPVCTVEFTLARLGLHVYPMTDVHRYLDAIFKGREGWVWVPLRDKDKIMTRGFNDTDKRTYSQPIPYPVLRTVEQLETEHPDSGLCFFVSDQRQPSDEKDPFLLVTIKNNPTYWVIERWDEPSFSNV